jgi:DNA invertase Pin-like site-specific DNA recombinase
MRSTNVVETNRVETRNKVVRCAIYTRVSTDEQTRRDYNSLESQRDICRHAIAVKQHEHWIEGDHFDDGGYSGKDLDRPAIQRLLAAVRTGNVDAIIVYKLDRLTRSISDFYALWEVFKEHDVIFVSATQSFDTSDPMGNLMLNMLLSFGQFERELTSEPVRHKNLERAKRGLWNGGWVPTGYNYDKNSKVLKPESDEAPLVKRIFTLAKKLKSPTAVADALNELGLVTKTRTITRRTGERKEVGGKRWIGDRVTRIVTNPIYRGIIAHNDIEYGGHHKPLVSAKLWSEANKALASVDAPARPHAERNKHEMLLKGILRCGHCGNLMTPKPSGKKDPNGNPYLYYSCGDVTKDGSASPCQIRNISSKGFEEFVVKVVGEIGKHPEVIASTLAASKTEGSKSIRPLKKKAAKLEKEFRIVCEELKTCVDVVKKQGADKIGGEFLKEAEELAARKEKLEIERETIQMDIRRKEHLVVEEGHIANALLEFKKVFDTLMFEEQKELVALLIREIRVSRFDPDKDDSPADPDVFKVKMRTSWYRVSFQFYLNPLFDRVLKNDGTGSHLNKDGGQGGIRTLGTLLRHTRFPGEPIRPLWHLSFRVKIEESGDGNLWGKRIGTQGFCASA